MSRFDAWRYRLTALFRRHRFDRELDEEIRFHLELEAMQRAAAGTGPKEASYAARRRFGNVTVVREETRSMGLAGIVDTIGQDLRYAIRSLKKSPIFTLVAVSSLALGIGANTAVFGMLHALLLVPLPVERPEELVQLARTRPGTPERTFDAAEYVQLRDSIILRQMAAWWSNGAGIEANGAQMYSGAHAVSGTYFSLLGLRPLRGRFITAADEERAAPVAVVSFDFWQSTLALSDSVVGTQIRINDQSVTIIGVTPQGYRGIEFPGRFQVAVPLSLASTIWPSEQRSPRLTPVNVVARLRSADRFDATATVLNARFQRIAKSPMMGARSGDSAERLALLDISRGISAGKFDLREIFGRVLGTLMGGVLVLLLIACANIAGLQLARGAKRRRELAIRLSVGASRWRVVRQILSETMIIGAVGGAAAIAVAFAATGLLARSLPENMAMLSAMVQLRPSPMVLAFTFAVAILTIVLCGLVPALRVTRVAIGSVLTESSQTISGGSRGRLGDALIVVQLALALLLTDGAVLFARSLRALRSFDGGFDTSNTLTVSIDARGTALAHAPLAPIAMETLDRARRMPGVRTAGLATITVVAGGRTMTSSVDVLGAVTAPDVDRSVELNSVSNDFVRAVGIRVVRGRDFTAAEVASAARVAMVSEAFVRARFGGREPLGQRVRLNQNDPWLEVIGVTGDARYLDIRSPANPMLYVPFTVTAGAWPNITLNVRTIGDPLVLAPALRREIDRIAPGIRIARFSTLTEQMDQVLMRERFAAALSSFFGALALSLACIGLYGLMTYVVGRRTNEIGVRMALGARSLDVLRLIMRDAAVLTAIGVVIGLSVAVPMGRVLGGQLFGVDPGGIVSLAIPSLLLAGAALLAGFLPARRASHTDPRIVMRAD
jgi:predicted permease